MQGSARKGARDMQPGDKVRVHYNLHKGNFSVVDPKTQRVIANVATVTLRDVEFRVSEAGRQRTIRNKRRKVHAYAIGYLVTTEAQDTTRLKCVTYNPYRAGCFHVQGDVSAEVWEAERVTFADAYCYASK
jgi:hypothetical protein